MQAFCSITAAILVLATPAECKTPTDNVTVRAGATSVQYAGYGLPRLPSVPKLPSVPRLPRVPKWP
jgi:hypothetical protein